MAKYRGWVKYKVPVEFEIDDNASDSEIDAMAEQVGDDNWKGCAEVDEIDVYEQ